MPTIEPARTATAEALAAAQRIEPSVANVAVHHPEGSTAAEKAKPQRVLIHVRQMHDASALDDQSQVPADARAALARYLPAARQQIETVLGAFANRQLAGNGVYLEGMDPTVAASYSENLRELRAGAGTVQLLERAFQSTSSEQTTALLAKLKERFPEPRNREAERVINAATTLQSYQSLREQVESDPVLRLAAAGRIGLRGAEDTQLHRANTDYVQQHPDATVDDPAMVRMMNARDTHLVNTVGASREPVSVAVLGAGHDLKPEVAAWNSAHPEDRITLVEVEPAAVTSYLNGSEKSAKVIGAR